MAEPASPESSALPGVVGASKASRQERVWMLAAVGAVWLLAINQLRIEWAINPQYSYGWVVPLLALYLYGERWQSRPQPGAPSTSGWLLALAAVAASILLPIRVLQEAASDWRLVSWALTAAVVTLSLLAVQAAGGGRWVRHFWFPVCFIFVAVPWPMPLENALVQTLMRTVASTCAEILWWCGMPALQEGNVIRVGATAVGVEEACSGVRSLQTTIMVSLFLGELFRFAVWRRLALLAVGLLVAFVFNLARAMALVWLATFRGEHDLERWHDPIGWAVLGASLTALLGLAAIMHRRTPEEPSKARPGRPIPPQVLRGLLLWLVFVEGGTQLWYRLHETGVRRTPPWTIEFPVDRPAYQERALPENTRVILRYDASRSANWREEDGTAWSLIFLRWNPGNASSRLPRNHTPEICLAAIGAKLESKLAPKIMQIGTTQISVYRYLFQVRGTPLHVFYALSEDRGERIETEDLSQTVTGNLRLQDAWHGQRGLGQQVLEIAVSGFAGMEEAEAALGRFLNEQVQAASKLPPAP